MPPRQELFARTNKHTYPGKVFQKSHHLSQTDNLDQLSIGDIEVTRFRSNVLKIKEDEDMPNPGETVLVPTKVKDGAFPGERFVTVQTNTGPVSGFAKADFVIEKPDGQYLLAEVKKVSGNALTVRLFGSFFTTTGMAEIPKDTLKLKAAG